MRHYLGRVFATAASLVLALPIYDTQCGAKLFRANRQIFSLFAQPFMSRWIFDVEIIARYLTTFGSGAGIYELPLDRWTDIGDSRVKSADFIRASGELANIYRAHFVARDKRRVWSFVTGPLLRYVSAGGVGTTLHFATLVLLVELLAVAPGWATLVGAIVGAIANYLLNYHFTFASNISHRVALPKFVAVAVLGAIVGGGGLWAATKSFGIHYLVAQIACTGIVLLLGFASNQAWTFRAKRN